MCTPSTFDPVEGRNADSHCKARNMFSSCRMLGQLLTLSITSNTRTPIPLMTIWSLSVEESTQLTSFVCMLSCSESIFQDSSSRLSGNAGSERQMLFDVAVLLYERGYTAIIFRARVVLSRFDVTKVSVSQDKKGWSVKCFLTVGCFSTEEAILQKCPEAVCSFPK